MSPDGTAPIVTLEEREDWLNPQCSLQPSPKATSITERVMLPVLRGVGHISARLPMISCFDADLEFFLKERRTAAMDYRGF